FRCLMMRAMRFCPRNLAVLTVVLLSQPARAELPAPATPQATSTAALPAPLEPLQAAQIQITLGQAVERFGQENLRLAAARYEINATRADIIAAGLLPNPRLALAGGWHIHGESDSADQQ